MVKEYLKRISKKLQKGPTFLHHVGNIVDGTIENEYVSGCIDFVGRHKYEIAAYGAYCTALIVGAQTGRSVINSSIEHGPHNPGIDEGLYVLKEGVRDILIPVAKGVLAAIPLGVKYLRRKKEK